MPALFQRSRARRKPQVVMRELELMHPEALSLGRNCKEHSSGLLGVDWVEAVLKML
jgi:hypothetical protein